MQYHIEYREIDGRGRGIFALKDFVVGEIIETCPVVVLSEKESRICDQTILEYYTYPWEGNEDGCIALGYGSLYNHSLEPNAEYDLMYKDKTIVYKALLPIKRGDEILVNYNGDSKDISVMDLLPSDRFGPIV